MDSVNKNFPFVLRVPTDDSARNGFDVRMTSTNSTSNINANIDTNEPRRCSLLTTPPNIKMRRSVPTGRIPTYADLNSILLKNEDYDYESDSDSSFQDFGEPMHMDATPMHMDETTSSSSSFLSLASPRDLASLNVSASNEQRPPSSLSTSSSLRGRFDKTDAPRTNLFGGSAFSAYHSQDTR